MNTFYKIDESSVLVADAYGNIRQIPKYTDVEEILKLENEIETLDEQIKGGQQVIQSNIQRCQQKQYRCARLYSKLSIAFILLCVALGSILGIALQLIGGLWIALCAIPGIIALNKFDDVIKEQSDILTENREYSQGITYLQCLKQAKEEEIQQRKQCIDFAQTLKEKTMVEMPKKDYLQFLKEALKTIKNMGLEPSMETVVDTKRAMQKVWKINR